MKDRITRTLTRRILAAGTQRQAAHERGDISAWSHWADRGGKLRDALIRHIQATSTPCQS
jgi:hypothetical protein